MKFIIQFVIFILPLVSAVGQNSYLIGNIMLNNTLDKNTIPSEVGFQFSSRISLSGQFPIYFDTLKQKELISLELGLGNLFNSLYYKSSYLENPKSISAFNIVDGFFLKAEPFIYLWQNTGDNLLIHLSLNNVLYYFGHYESNSGYFDKDTNEVRLITTSSSNSLQYALEPYLGISYLLKLKKGEGILFRLKHAFVFHEQYIAKMSLSNRDEISFIKLNDQSWVFSVAWLLSKNK